MVRMLLVAFRVLVWWPFDSLAQDIDFERILSGFGDAIWRPQGPFWGMGGLTNANCGPEG